jgi:hypothetical protein
VSRDPSVTADDIRAAVDRIRSQPYRSPTDQAPVMHPIHYRMAQDAGLIRQDGTIDWREVAEALFHGDDPITEVSTWVGFDARIEYGVHAVIITRYRRRSGTEWTTTRPREDTDD